MALKKYCRLLMTGDSVTDCGRARPVGTRAGMGSGYPSYIETMLCAKHPELCVWCENTGISGNTSKALLERFDEDVIARKPDIVTIMIGINDVWRHFDVPYFPADHISEYQYRENMIAMIEKCRDNGIELILITPNFLDLNKSDPMRRMNDRFIAVLKELSDKYGVRLLDMQKIFDRYIRANNTSYLLSADRVHPNSTGHYLIADALYKELLK